MSDKIEVTGIEIKINGKKISINIEDAWELKRELDKLLHVESVPYPYPIYPNYPQWIWTDTGTAAPKPYWSGTTSAGGFSCEIVDSETVGLINTF